MLRKRNRKSGKVKALFSTNQKGWLVFEHIDRQKICQKEQHLIRSLSVSYEKTTEIIAPLITSGQNFHMRKFKFENRTKSTEKLMIHSSKIRTHAQLTKRNPEDKENNVDMVEYIYCKLLMTKSENKSNSLKLIKSLI